MFDSIEVPQIIIATLIAGIGSQLYKFVIEGITKRHLNWKLLNSYGGMPSSHTAFVAALTTAVGIEEGIASAPFAIVFVLSSIIVRDAIGFRRYLGTHGRMINMLVRDLPDVEEFKYPYQLNERIGHTPFEAFVGGCVGILVSIFCYLFIF